MPDDKIQVGTVTHFFGKLHLASIELSATLKVGDTISIEGPHGALEETVDSMRLDNRKVREAGAGAGVGIKVKDKVGVGDKVFIVGHA